MEKTPNLINLHTVNIKNWLQEANNVYIGRRTKYTSASVWGNPYIVNRPYRRKRVIKLYEQRLHRNVKLLKSVSKLKGKCLGCWCAPKPCHGEILHRLAGNQPVYQEAQPYIYRMENKAIKEQDKELDQKVTATLQAMSDIMENLGHDVSDAVLSIPTVQDIPTPTFPSMSTIETNQIYETLTEPKTPSNISSYNSSFERDFPQCIPVSMSPGQSQDTHSSTTKIEINNSERFELEYKLRAWRSQQSQSFNLSTSATTTKNLQSGRESRSAPASPVKQCSDDSISNPPSPFSYNSTMPGLITQTTNATEKILEFLANKVDLLAININTIQYNLTKIHETFQHNFEDKVPESLHSIEQTVIYKCEYLEEKFDSYKKIVDKEHKLLKEENMQLRDRLEGLIIKETEREDMIKECLNNSQRSPNPSLTDFQPLREDMEKKLRDLDKRLVECEQYSRRENLVISGIPRSVKQEQLEQKVIEILAQIGLKLIPDDISACHRLYNPPHSEYPAKVVVRFCNRKIVNFCLLHRDNLQEKAYQNLRLNLRFFESLCSKNEESLRISKWLKREHKIQDYFLRNGFVKVVLEEHGRPQKIFHPDDLRKKFHVPVEI